MQENVQEKIPENGAMPHQTVMGTMPHDRLHRLDLLHAPLDHLGHSEGSHVVGVLTGTEAGIIAQLLSQLVGDTRTTAADDKLVTQALGLQKLNEVGEVLDVNVLLRNGLGDQQNIGVQLQSLLDEVLIGDLRAKVVASIIS